LRAIEVMTEHKLDLRGIACPMNFVKTKLFLDKLSHGDVLRVFLDAGEPVESVSESIQQEGHELLENISQPEGHCLISIRKV